jgi:hypothetical protein
LIGGAEAASISVAFDLAPFFGERGFRPASGEACGHDLAASALRFAANLPQAGTGYRMRHHQAKCFARMVEQPKRTPL